MLVSIPCCKCRNAETDKEPRVLPSNSFSLEGDGGQNNALVMQFVCFYYSRGGGIIPCQIISPNLIPDIEN